MIVVGSSYKAVIAYAHNFPQTLEVCNYLVNILFGSNAFFLCLKLDFLSVLVCAGKEHYIVALHSLEACDSVTRNRCVTVSYVRISRRVIYRGSNIVSLVHFNILLD